MMHYDDHNYAHSKTEGVESLVEQDIRAQIETYLYIRCVGSAGHVVVYWTGCKFLVLRLELFDEVIYAGIVVIWRALVIFEGSIILDSLLFNLLLKKVSFVKKQNNC